MMGRVVFAFALGCVLEAANAGPVVGGPVVATPPWQLPTFVYPTAVENPVTGSTTDYSAKNGKGYSCLNVTELHRGPVNHSTDDGKNNTCYKSLVWAKDTGLKKTWADKCYPNLTKDSTMYQFQWALFAQAKVGIGAECVGWGCPLPCGMAGAALTAGIPLVQTYQATAAPTAPPTVPPVAATPPPTVPPTAAPAGFPVWGIVLLILVALALCGAIGFYVMNQGKGAQKKKRAVKPVAPEQKPLVAPPTTYAAPTTAIPMATTYAAPMASYRIQQPAPMVTTVQAAPMFVERPVHVAAPASVSYAAPTYTSASPHYAVMEPMTAAPRAMTAMELFDELDINKDGRVSREEFQQIAQQRGIPM